MKGWKLHLLPAVVLLLSLFCGPTIRAQITPSADAYTNTATPTTNYGSKPLFDVDGATQIATFDSIWHPFHPARALAKLH